MAHDLRQRNGGAMLRRSPGSRHPFLPLLGRRRCSRADEMNVVADEDERSVKLIQRANERVDRANIQMRSWLVHEQEVGGIEQQLNQGETPFFFAAQDFDLFENIVTAKKKRAKNGARGLLGHRIRRVQRSLKDGEFRIEHLDSVLREVTDANIVADSRVPCCTGNTPPSNLSRVDLPAPFGPTRTVRCPRSA